MTKSLSPEHRKAISDALRGKPFSEEHRAKLSAKAKGRTASEEARARMSAAGKGRPKSPAHRKAIGDALRGKLKTEEVNYHIVHSRMGAASDHLCECGAQARDWAYQYTAVEELVSPEGWLYSANPADYKPMCRRCHKRLDCSR